MENLHYMEYIIKRKGLTMEFHDKSAWIVYKGAPWRPCKPEKEREAEEVCVVPLVVIIVGFLTSRADLS